MDKNKVIESASKLIAKGQLEKAVKEYQRVLEVDPDDVRVLQKLAELYQKMKRPAEAADCFEKVARTYATQGFYLKAVALYKQVLKVVERIEVNVRLAELYQQLGLTGDAAKEWHTVASHYEKTGDSKASLDTLKKLVDLDPDNVASRIRLGEQYARQENVAEAVVELRRAAQYLQRNSRQDDYFRVVERISHLDPSDAGLAKELANHYLSKGDSKRALAKLQVCFKVNPRDLDTLQMLARAFQELGQVSKTVSVLKELARVHGDAGRGDEAQKVYQKAAELAPDDAELKSVLVRPAAVEASPVAPRVRVPTPAPVRAAVGSPARAAPIPTPMPMRPVEPAAPGTIGKLLKETEVYVKYGLHEKALDHLRKILAADPDNLEAHEKAKTLALATNRQADAIVELATLVRLYAAQADGRLDAATEELRNLDPQNAALAASGEGEMVEVADEDAIELEADEAIELVPEGESAPGVEVSLESQELPAAEVPPAPVFVERSFEEAIPTPMPQRRVDPALAAPLSMAAAPAEDAFASDLAEADFYLESGMVEEARSILEGIRISEPDHTGANERLARLANGADDQAAIFDAPTMVGDIAHMAAPAAGEVREHDDLTDE